MSWSTLPADRYATFLAKQESRSQGFCAGASIHQHFEKQSSRSLRARLEVTVDEVTQVVKAGLVTNSTNGTKECSVLG